jgi:hypothetical protein
MRARKSPQQATVATAHKIARIVYRLLQSGSEYQEVPSEIHEAQRREREIRQLTKRANKLGLTITQGEGQPAALAP